MYEFDAVRLDGRTERLERYRGEVLLVVNVASRCGFTPQYAGLEALYRRYKDRGFTILGFPCNQFGGQEPGAANEIREFCRETYAVSFPLFAKVDVNGADAHPLYRWLAAEMPGVLGLRAIKWNFTKFLIGRDGRVLKRYGPRETPETIEADLEAALVAGVPHRPGARD